MKEVMNACWDLLSGLCISVWGLLSTTATWLGDVLYQLHVGAPRLEGLLVGVLLAWLLLRREKHPILRVLSSPLKLIVDILDLAWDQGVEVVSDLWGTTWGWITKVWNGVWGRVFGALSWVKNKVVATYNGLMNFLKSIKDKLSKKENKE